MPRAVSRTDVRTTQIDAHLAPSAVCPRTFDTSSRAHRMPHHRSRASLRMSAEGASPKRKTVRFFFSPLRPWPEAMLQVGEALERPGGET
jgi:hypothetical protein